MIDLGATDFYFGVPSMSKPEFEAYSMRLFDEWERYVEKTLMLPDYSLALEVEEGSIKGGGKIAAALTALYLGVGNYGSFMSGFQTIRDQVASISDYLVTQATSPFGSNDYETRVKRRSGSLGHLHRLFTKVQRREITADEAMREAEALLGDEASTAPEFMNELHTSLEQTRRFPEQLLLLTTPELESMAVPKSDKERRPRPSRPTPAIPPPQHLRVEVWRESKGAERSFRVTDLGAKRKVRP